MPNTIYQQYQSLIRKIDLSETAGEVFLELTKTEESIAQNDADIKELPNQILYITLLKLADQFKPVNTAIATPE